MGFSIPHYQFPIPPKGVGQGRHPSLRLQRQQGPDTGGLLTTEFSKSPEDSRKDQQRLQELHGRHRWEVGDSWVSP